MSRGAISDHWPAGTNTFQMIFQGTSQIVNFSTASVQSTIMQPQTTAIRLYATQDCFVQIGTDKVPNATASTSTSMFLAKGLTDYFGVIPNSSVKIAVIRDSADGKLYLTEGA